MFAVLNQALKKLVLTGHLTVTDTTGVRAGEEMLAWMHARVAENEERTTPSWRCGTS